MEIEGRQLPLRASLTQSVSDALPSPQVMRRISMSVTRTRQSGVRRQLAIQHIHEGHNYFGVSLPGGQTSFLVVDYDGLQLVDNPTVRPLQPRWDTAWLDHEGNALVSQWQVGATLLPQPLLVSPTTTFRSCPDHPYVLTKSVQRPPSV